jgi:hypothetical protein
MNGLTPELLLMAIAGGLFQAGVLVAVQAVYLKRSSLGVKLEALRTEVALRDREIRMWVKDSLAQMEADSITRDITLRQDLMDTRSEIRAVVADAMRDPATLQVQAEYTVGAFMARLMESKHVRLELALLAETEDQKRRRQRRERTKGETMAHRVWATGVDEPGTFFVGTTGEDYAELNPDVATVLDPQGSTLVRYAQGNGSIPEVGPNAPSLPSNGLVSQGFQYVTMKAASGTVTVLVSLP